MAMASTATLGLPIALMFLAGLAYSSQMQIKKSSSVQLPEGAFTANLTWEGTKLQMQCSALAKKSGHYFFKHDSKGICQAGSADFGQLGTGTERIVTADIPFVGILLGNSEGDIDLEVVLPNGKTCPPSSHGLPPYSIAGRPPTDRHGMAELHGVLYKLGGRRYPDLSATAAFEKLDLTSPSPAWVALPDAPFAWSNPMEECFHATRCPSTLPALRR